MPEEFSASTEVAAPATSGVESPVTSASGQGASEQPSQPVTQPAANAGATAEDTSIDVGWKLDLDEQPEAPVDASQTDLTKDQDEDADLDALAKDPALDPQKTPGLVKAIKDARLNQREARQQLGAVKQEITQMNEQFQAFGGPKGALEILTPMVPFFRAEEGSGKKVLDSIWANSQPAYRELINTAYNDEKEYFLQRLQEDGLIPQVDPSKSSQPSSTTITPELLETIPEHLRETAKRLAKDRPSVFEDLSAQSDEVRDYNLERELKLFALDERTAETERKAWDAQVSGARDAGRQAARSLSDQYEKGHYQQLEKWKPYGDDTARNQRLYGDIIEGAFAELLKVEEYAKYYDDAHQGLHDAPLLKLHGEEFKAAQNERDARAMALKFNSRLGQLIKERVQERAAEHSDALKWRELQRQKEPRKEVDGQGTPLTGGGPGKVKTLTADGKISDEYVESLIRSLPGA